MPATYSKPVDGRIPRVVMICSCTCTRCIKQDDDDDLLGNSGFEDRPAGGGPARTRKVGCPDRVSARPERGMHMSILSLKPRRCMLYRPGCELRYALAGLDGCNTCYSFLGGEVGRIPHVSARNYSTVDNFKAVVPRSARPERGTIINSHPKALLTGNNDDFRGMIFLGCPTASLEVDDQARCFADTTHRFLKHKIV